MGLDQDISARVTAGAAIGTKRLPSLSILTTAAYTNETWSGVRSNMLPIDERAPVVSGPSVFPETAPFSIDLPNKTALQHLTRHLPGKRTSAHTQMYEREQLNSSVTCIPLVMATFADSLASVNVDDGVFHVVYSENLSSDDVASKDAVNRLDTLSVLDDRLSMDEFLLRHRPLLPPGVRAEFRRMIFVKENAVANNSHLPNMSTSSVRKIRPFLEEKRAIESLNPWFLYDKLFHQCRTDFSFHHRTIDWLSTQSLNKDQLRELLVVLHGQHYMIRAPDLYSQWNDFITGFWQEHQYYVDQLWIDLQKLNDVYGSVNASVQFVLQRSSSIGSLSTTRQSNTSKTRINQMSSSPTLIEL
jgi:hypothetical protein